MNDRFPLDFVSGAIAAGYLTLGLFFLRFWRRSRDALFANFAAAFWLLCVNQVAATLTGGDREPSWVYLIRLAAFVVIIVAIVRKNLGRARRP